MRTARLTLGILYLVAIFSIAGTALARDDETNAAALTRDGWYFGAQWNMGLEDWKIPGATVDPTATVANSQGLSAYIGWRFLESWGIDFQYEWQHGFATTFSGAAGEANAHVLTLNGRYYIPFIPFERIQPYGLVGLGLFQTSRTDGALKTAKGDFTGRFGGGLDIYLTKNWVIEGSGTFVLPTGAQNDQRYWSIGAGLQYRFDPHIY